MGTHREAGGRLSFVRQVVAAFLFAGLIAACGRTDAPRRDEASPQPTSTTIPTGGRIRTSYFSDPYEERGDCLCHFRVDAPPGSVVATHTPEEVLTATSRHRAGDNYPATAWFGVFTGNVMKPNAPDGRLTGVRWVTDLPAWLVITHDTERVTHGKTGPPVEGSYTYDVEVFPDSDLSASLGSSLTGFGAEPVLH